MTTTTATAHRATYGDLIQASDFSDNTADPNRNLWFEAQMHYVIEALAGSRVAIVVDTQTGFTVVNARLIRLWHGHYTGVLVETTLSDGTTQQTAHPLFKIGVIIELDSHEQGVRPGGSAHFRATAAYRETQSRAIRAAQAHLHKTHYYGKWTASPDRSGGASVRFVPSSNPPADAIVGTRWYGYVNADGIVTSSQS